MLGLSSSIAVAAAPASSAAPASPRAAAEDAFRDTFLLSGEWRALGVGPDLGPIPDAWHLTIPTEAAPVLWPGTMDLAVGQNPTSLTLLFWRPVEAPRRWMGKAVWLEIPYLPGPARVFLNAAPVSRDDLAGGSRREVGLTPYLAPGDSNLLVLEITGADAALRLLRGDPPRLRTAPQLHLSHIRVRPASEGEAFWIDAGLREFPGAGTARKPDELKEDEYSVEFEVREGPEEAGGPVVPGATLVSHRINRRQMNIVAPVPVEGRRLWSPADPALYTVTATLRRDDKPVDRLAVTAGFAAWRIERFRLYLNDAPVPLFSLTLSPRIVQFAEEGAWAEVAERTGELGARSPALHVNLARARRRGFWLDVLRPLKAVGVTMVRCGDAAPPALLDAADRIGILVEQRIEPSPKVVDPEWGGGLSSALVVAEAVRRDQTHPSLAIWRIEAQGGAAHLDALANALVTLDGAHPALAFVRDDQRVRRPGILRQPGVGEARAVLETALVPETTSLLRSWEMYARLVPAGRKLPVTLGWAWAPEAWVLDPDTLALAAERFLLGRANPASGGIGLRLLEPDWARARLPLAHRLPPVDELLWPFRDAATSPTLAAAIRNPCVMISPEVVELRRGERQSVEVVVLLAPFEPSPAEAVLRLRLRPSPDRRSAFAPSESESLMHLARFAGDADVVRAGVEIDVNEEIPPGPAVLEAEVEWSGAALRSGPHDVMIQTGK